MAALDVVGVYEADPTVMLEDVPQDIVFKTLKVSCACVAVLVFACVCVCARAPSICVRENLYLHFLKFVCVCVHKGSLGKSRDREIQQRSSNTLYCRVNVRVNDEMRRDSCSSSLINFVLNLSKLFLMNRRMSSS
jgi:hypothetical protein